MKICNRHWEAFTESLNINVLPLVSTVVSEEMLIYRKEDTLESEIENFEFGLKYNNNPKKFEEEVNKNNGCPICFLGEGFYNRILEIMRKENDKKD